MVNIVFTVISLVVIVAAVATKSTVRFDHNESEEDNVLSATTTSSPNPTPTPTPSPIPTPTQVPTPTLTPNATLTPEATRGLIDAWEYSISQNKTKSANSLDFTSTDTAKNITAWYKEKMIALGFKSKSVIQTQSNEKVLNKLSGASSTATISIEITQENSAAPVQVKVNLGEGTPNADINVSVNNSI